MSEALQPSGLHLKLPEELIAFCREQRKNSTSPEGLLWRLLRDRRLLGYKFRRQHPLGGYILDFYCHEARLAVELDGGGYLDEKQAVHDQHRTEELAGLGVRVLRFWNNEVLQEIEAVLELIAHELETFTSSKKKSSSP